MTLLPKPPVQTKRKCEESLDDTYLYLFDAESKYE